MTNAGQRSVSFTGSVMWMQQTFGNTFTKSSLYLSSWREEAERKVRERERERKERWMADKIQLLVKEKIIWVMLQDGASSGVLQQLTLIIKAFQMVCACLC